MISHLKKEEEQGSEKNLSCHDIGERVVNLSSGTVHYGNNTDGHPRMYIQYKNRSEESITSLKLLTLFREGHDEEESLSKKKDSKFRAEMSSMLKFSREYGGY